MAASVTAYALNSSVTRSAGISMIQKRMVLILALLLSVAGTASAQSLTVMPTARQQFLDSNGNPLASGKLYTYAAGTTTLLSTCTDSSNPCTVPHANPIILDSAGRATIFLTRASYKFTLHTSADVLVWSVDNVSSVSSFNVDLDVSCTAGEALSAGDAAYLCAGGNCATAGRWYKADADALFSATGSEIGFATAAIASGSAGSCRMAGRLTGLSGLTTGSPYYVSSTAGAITLTPPTNTRYVGRADSTTSLIIDVRPLPAGPLGPPCGRLTLTTGVPVTVSDVTAATTLYYAPYGGCTTISTFDGTGWQQSNFSQLSIAVPAVANQVYDVFVYDNAGTLALELTAWTNDTTRATALTTQNSVYVKTGVLTRLYLGTVRTITSGQLNDSAAFRHVWNYYRRVPRALRKVDATASWTYNTAAFRQARADTTNQVDVVVGVAEVLLNLSVFGDASNNSAAATGLAVAIGEDSTTTAMAASVGRRAASNGVAGPYWHMSSRVDAYPAVGRHYYVWLEYSDANATTTWSGSQVNGNNGLTGFIEG